MSNRTSSSLSVSAPAMLLGIPGLRLHEVWDLADERHLLVDSPPRTGVCAGCGQRAESKGRVTVHLRDLPSAGKATRLVWVKRVWRCGDCGSSWRERHPGLPSRSVLTARARTEAARQVGEQRASTRQDYADPRSRGCWSSRRPRPPPTSHRHNPEVGVMGLMPTSA